MGSIDEKHRWEVQMGSIKDEKYRWEAKIRSKDWKQRWEA